MRTWLIFFLHFTISSCVWCSEIFNNGGDVSVSQKSVEPEVGFISESSDSGEPEVGIMSDSSEESEDSENNLKISKSPAEDLFADIFQV